MLCRSIDLQGPKIAGVGVSTQAEAVTPRRPLPDPSIRVGSSGVAVNDWPRDRLALWQSRSPPPIPDCRCSANCCRYFLSRCWSGRSARAGHAERRWPRRFARKKPAQCRFPGAAWVHSRHRRNLCLYPSLDSGGFVWFEVVFVPLLFSTALWLAPAGGTALRELLVMSWARAPRKGSATSKPAPRIATFIVSLSSSLSVIHVDHPIDLHGRHTARVAALRRSAARLLSYSCNAFAS